MALRAFLRTILLLVSGFLLSCGTYRTSEYHAPGGFKGVGDYRTPSDYSTESGPDSAAEQQRARDHGSPPPAYAPQGPFKLHWPVEAVRINRGFQTEPLHQGLDLGGSYGTPILAAHEGVVVYAGHEFNGYGNMILLEYDHQWATLYGHLTTFTVREGAVVQAGSQIGTMGATGHATGVHLHFELLHNRQPTDPLALLTRPATFAANRKKLKSNARN